MTGRKPALCHPDRVVEARGLCVSCYSKWHYRTFSHKYPRAKCHPKEPKHAHGLCKLCYSRWWQHAYLDNRTRAMKLYNRNGRMYARYGLTIDDYRKRLEDQHGLCAICGKPAKRLVVDHDHNLNKARGLLCHGCNIMVGFLERRDFENAKKYLAFWRQKLSPEIVTA